MSEALPALIEKIKDCQLTEDLINLKNEFEACGLALRRSVGRNLLICRIINGVPTAESINRDYYRVPVFNDELGDRTKVQITNFVLNNFNPAEKIISPDNPLGRGNVGFCSNDIVKNNVKETRNQQERSVVEAMADLLDEMK